MSPDISMLTYGLSSESFPKTAHHHDLSRFSDSSSKHSYKRSYSSIESGSANSPHLSPKTRSTMNNYGGAPRPAVSPADFASPPDSRRPSGDDQKEQRLPSLSEALGDRSFQYTTPPSTANSISQSIPPPLISPTHAQIRPPTGEEYRQGAGSRSMSEGTISLGSQVRPTMTQPLEPKFKSEFQTSAPFALPSFSSLDAPQSSPFGSSASRASIPTQLNSTFEHSSTHSTSSVSSMGASPYQHPALAPNFGDKPNLPFHPAGASAHSASDADQARQWEANKRHQSIKRRMESFDFGATLQNIERISLDIHQFSQRHQSLLQQARQYQTNTLPLPSFKECDEMLSRQHQLLEALTTIRDAASWQANPNDPNLASDSGRMATMPPQDSKKRRPRAAPPGRCHSCNRAETPEWRRGPDGARTLCNACGLHFAKSERKNNAKAAAAAASALKNQVKPPDSSPSASGNDSAMGNGGGSLK